MEFPSDVWSSGDPSPASSNTAAQSFDSVDISIPKKGHAADELYELLDKLPVSLTVADVATELVSVTLSDSVDVLFIV